MRTDEKPKTVFLPTTGTRSMTFATGPVRKTIRVRHTQVSTPYGTLAPWPLDIVTDGGGRAR